VGPLEREEELATLREALAAAAERRGSVVTISGEPGIGKSSIVQAWAREPGMDARMLVGWCDDLLTRRILGPFHDVVRTSGGALAAAVRSGETSAVLDEALTELDDPLRPTALVLEDVHWADEATLDVVRYVGRRIGRLPAVLVLTYREDVLGAEHPLRGVLGALPGGAVHRLHPRPLTTRAISQLAAGDPFDVEEVARVTGGNPFFVAEVLRGDGGVPESVTDAVVAALRALPDPTQHGVGQLAVFPRAVPLALVTALVDDLSVLAPAESRGLLVVDEDAPAVRFRHELVRQAVLTSLPAAERIRHHEAAVQQLLGDEGDVALLLHHAVQAGRGDIVARYAPGAAHAAFDADAHREAVGHQDHALRHERLLDRPVLAWLLVERSWSMYNLHRFEDALVAARRAVALYGELGDDQTRCRMLLTTSRMLYIANRIEEALATFDEATELLEQAAERGPDPADGVPWPDSPLVVPSYDDQPWNHGPVHAEWRVNRLSLLELTGRHVEVLADAGPTLRVAQETTGRADLVAHAENYVGLATAMTGDVDEGLRRLRAAIRIAGAEGWDEATARAHTNLVELLVLTRRWEEATNAIGEAVAFYDDHDFFAHRYNTSAQRARVALQRGDWSGADRLLGGVQVQEKGIIGVIPAEARALLAVRRGDDDAEALVAAAWELALPTRSAFYLVPVAAAGIELAWALDRPAAADPYVGPALEAAAGSWWEAWLWWRLRLVRSLPDGRPTIGPEPERTSLAGDWRAAADAWERLGMPYEQALELLVPGEIEATLAALELLDGLGAAPAARRARQLLRAQGVRTLPRGPQPQTRMHPAGLTARQAEVLDLVAAGLTNAQIAQRLVLSVRTVDHHVAAVLQKLGVGSRQEAASTVASAPSTDG
jgi:DNA-binding CsgD family transcriptional regulator/tetratricopeptide (TPR) repeat protein